MVKSLESTTLGYLAEADLKHWPASLEKILEKYDSAQIVIPGHGRWGDMSLIRHTQKLLKQHASNER